MTTGPRTPDWLVWQIADSAFPAGGFAHSFGLEAAWQAGEVADRDSLIRLLRAGLLQTGYGLLPLVTSAHRAPDRWAALDDLAEAFLVNPVANRSSRVQGRAWLGTCARIWPSPAMTEVARTAPTRAGHVGPVMGLTLQQLGVPLGTVQELVLFLSARGLLSAAVRLGIVGSYEAQRLLFAAGPDLSRVLARCGRLGEQDLAQAAPVFDILQASHDRLYSRLFQS